MEGMHGPSKLFLGQFVGPVSQDRVKRTVTQDSRTESSEQSLRTVAPIDRILELSNNQVGDQNEQLDGTSVQIPAISTKTSVVILTLVLRAGYAVEDNLLRGRRSTCGKAPISQGIQIVISLHQQNSAPYMWGRISTNTEDPFKPRTKVTLRSPEKFSARERSHSLSEIALKLNKEISIISLSECEEDSPKQVGKRKRVSETQDPGRSRKDNVDTEVEELADKIKKINAMAKATMIPDDLKKAIAETARALSRLQVANKNRSKGMKEAPEEKTKEEGNRKMEPMVCSKCGTDIKKIDAETQTIDSKDINEDILTEQIRSCNNPNKFAELLNLAWPEKAYQKTRIEKGRIEDIDKEWDLVIVTEGNFDNPHNIKIIENPHEYEAIKKQEAKPGEMAYLNRQGRGTSSSPRPGRPRPPPESRAGALAATEAVHETGPPPSWAAIYAAPTPGSPWPPWPPPPRPDG
ncbi:hypothetical protein WN55_01926 [Dufourea novaeangliae]|uniref:Uncharacterized protein n=1 Tax=Dufourea novaeangliae TaxID=178035 RepID=A0A154PFW1_DUFNO|nr:hypothetical protein WN55_01926 [Dufourea novaeangliae]